MSTDVVAQFISRDLYLWAYARGVTLDFSPPGKLTDNAFIEYSSASSGRSAERALVHEPGRRAGEMRRLS